MGNYTVFLMFENTRRSRQARNFTENDPKILNLKSSSEQIIFRKLSSGAPVGSPVVSVATRSEGTLRLYTTVGWDGWKRTRAAWGQDGKKARKIST